MRQVVPLICLVALCSCSKSDRLVTRHADGSIELFDGRVIPPMPELLGIREQYDLRMRWLEQKHRDLLPMMRRHGIDMWIVTNEEFHFDPVTEYIAPERYYTDNFLVHVFIDAGGDELERFTSYRRQNADHKRFFQALPPAPDVSGGGDIAARLSALYQRYRPERIGLNMDGPRGHTRGITHYAYEFLSDALGREATRRFVPATELIEDYFDTRLPEELEYYRDQVLATDILAQRALSNEVITPGVTRAVDVKTWFNQQVASLGVGAEPWFEMTIATQRFDRETGRALPYAHPSPDSSIIRRGDVIRIDCGFDYLGFATDWQKVAYILLEDEDDVPEGFKLALRNANMVQEAMRSAPRPGMTGYEAAAATMELLQDVDFLPSLYSHSLGYHGHALGPSINARNGVLGDPPQQASRLRLGSYRAIELSAKTAIPEWNGDSLLVPMEDDAYLTEDGFEWIRPIQKEWYLIR